MKEVVQGHHKLFVRRTRRGHLERAVVGKEIMAVEVKEGAEDQKTTEIEIILAKVLLKRDLANKINCVIM